MPATNAKRQALINEGLSEAEADFMMSGGTKTDGLNLGDTNATPGAKEEQPKVSTDDTVEKIPDAVVKDGQVEEDEPDPNAAVPYQKYARDKKRLKDQLAATAKERDDRLAELGTEREKWTRLDERMKLFREAMEQPDPAAAEAAKPKPKPDREADPFGYMAWLEEQFEGLKTKTEQTETVQRDRDAATELLTTFRTDAATYTRTNPDFWESQPNARDGAYHFLMRSRDVELQAAGYSDAQERMRIIAADERDIVARAFHARQTNPQAKGPAQVLYDLAVSRGFTKRAAPAAPAAAQPGQGSDQPKPAGQAQQPAATSVTEQVKAIERGQAASRSLSSAGGAPPPQGIDLAHIAGMDDNEYGSWLRELNPAQRKEYYSLIGAMGR